MRIKENYSLKDWNTFGIDVRCRRFVEYDTPEELATLIGQRPLLHIGGGSNLLFLGDYEGTVLHSAIRSIEPRTDGGDVLLRVGAAVVWDDLVAYTIGRGWYGLENLSLIPGEVGASAVQNIGAYGAEAKDFITEVECMDLQTGQRRVFTNAECQYAYRQSIFKTDEHRGRWAVLYVTYRLSQTFVPRLDYGGIRAELERKGIDISALTANQLRQTIIEIRKAKLPDPKVQGNAGSFFMNPVVSRAQYEALARQYPTMPHYDMDAERVKIPAGWMIEQCGWKGRSLGPAAVHDRQALVLVNRGGATGQDIVRLCEAVRHDVAARFGIDIHPEVNLIRP
ncbi:MAG: UDP-N-acetylmuramate dehydrogenase [Bacteroidaceae bacterium]|nr:UDP-N-acetylmuramate dehydrogenase [Bacteroidaceae bacterium]